MASLKTRYQEELRPSLMKEFSLSNKFAAPKIEKITLNVGTGKNYRDVQKFEKVKSVLTTIAAQQPISVAAKSSIAQFKTRKGMTIALKVTLRGDRMYDFLDRLISIALPRTRDFQGIEITKVDANGNVNFGIKEQIIFPELSNEELGINFGLQVNLTISNSNKEKSVYLLKSMGFPFKQ
ncbi:MAG: ribosomal protein [Candidatus Parcubacteria bacterium]|jgi:large subunit ribosomal protein L5